jgi:hypothetical protein
LGCRSSTSYAAGPALRRPSSTLSISFEHDGEDLRDLPLLTRRSALARLLRRNQAGIVFNEHIEEESSVVFAHACRLGAEGIVSKRVDAPYRSGPHAAWVSSCADPEEDRSLCHPLGAPKVQTVASPNQRGAGLVCAVASCKSKALCSLAAMSGEEVTRSRSAASFGARHW